MEEKGEEIMETKGAVRFIKEMDQYAEKYTANIDGQELQFTGRYYDRLLDPSDWQHGVCSVCGNVSGRTNIGRSDFCFCLEHREVWLCGNNSFGDQKTHWCTEEIEKQNGEFLKAVGKGKYRD